MFEVKNEISEKPEEHPEKKNGNKLSHFFNRFSVIITKATGSPYAFISALIIIIVWGVTGPIFHFSDTWQLVINTGTTIVTFLMVFIIQHSQNKDTTALQLKLNELIAASKASNKLISVEDLTDEELEVMKKFYTHLSSITKAEKQNKIHSLDDEEKEVILDSIKEDKKISEKKKS
jgi:low affinity Fe/Cu permease